MNKNELANRIADAFLHLDPYIGCDREEAVSATLAQLGTKEGCWRILEELSALVME